MQQKRPLSKITRIFESVEDHKNQLHILLSQRHTSIMNLLRQ